MMQRMKDKIKCFFYGDICMKREWRDKLRGAVEIHEHISHEEAIQKMKQMDVLMLLHSDKTDSDEVIPGKLFEYILAEKPILAIGPKDMQSSRIVRDNALDYTIDLYQDREINHKIQSLYQSWKENSLISYVSNDHPQFSRQYQFSRLLPILH